MNIFTSIEPLTESVSSIFWLSSSLFAWLCVRYFQRVRPAVLVGSMSSGMTAMPTSARGTLMPKSATRVVMTVATLLTMFDRVPLMTELTPLMSVFIRVIMSPCFSVVKKECGMYCRCLYI